MNNVYNNVATWGEGPVQVFVKLFKLLLQLCGVAPLLLLNYNVTSSFFMTKSTAEIS